MLHVVAEGKCAIKNNVPSLMFGLFVEGKLAVNSAEVNENSDRF